MAHFFVCKILKKESGVEKEKGSWFGKLSTYHLFKNQKWDLPNCVVWFCSTNAMNSMLFDFVLPRWVIPVHNFYCFIAALNSDCSCSSSSPITDLFQHCVKNPSILSFCRRIPLKISRFLWEEKIYGSVESTFCCNFLN